MSDRVFSRRMQVALAALLLALAACVARLAWLQIWRYKDYHDRALTALTSEELVPPTRGRILDATGEVLAEDAPSFDISVRVRDLKLREVVLDDVESYYDTRRKAAGPYLDAIRGKDRAVADLEEQNDLLLSAGGAEEEVLRKEIAGRSAAIAKLQAEIDKLAPEYRAAEAEFRKQREGAIARLAAREQTVVELSAISGVPREDLARGIMGALEHAAKRYEGAPPPIATNVDRRCWDRLYIRQHSPLMSGAERIPGVELTNGVTRRYPQGTSACHLVGYVKPMSELLYEGLAAGPETRSREELDGVAARLKFMGLAAPEPGGLAFLNPFGRTGDGRFFFKTSEGERTWLRPRGRRTIGRALPDERVGTYGVEKSHNQELRGQHAYRVTIRDIEGGGWRGGQQVRRFGEDVPPVPPMPGADVRLTVLLPVQKAAEKALAESGRNGAVVFLDASTGAVLAMASHPVYDPNAFVLRRNEEITRLFSDKSHPMLCRAYQSAYPPGSTFKPIISSGALEEGVIGPRTAFPCTGVLHLGRASFECLGTHGSIEFDMAMRKSCNLYFYHTGMKSGGERMARWAKNLGFGELSGIDLPGEREGLMPSPAWKRGRKLGSWTDGDSCNMVIGQGWDLVTPLQAAVAFAAIGNGGRVVRPHLVTEQKYVRRTLKFSPGPLAALKKSLYGVVNEGGTGRLAQLKDVVVAGKTGSAEHGGPGATHAWFCGYAPSADPTVAFAVVLERAGHGGSAAAPVARKVLEVLFNVEGETLTPTGEEQD